MKLKKCTITIIPDTVMAVLLIMGIEEGGGSMNPDCTSNLYSIEGPMINPLIISYALTVQLPLTDNDINAFFDPTVNDSTNP